MQTTKRIDSELTTRTPRADGSVRRHRLPMCAATGLARYRDRHQARQGASAMLAGSHAFETSTFACPDCRGYHLEKTYAPEQLPASAPESIDLSGASLASRTRRYVLFDVENPTLGAKATRSEVSAYWKTLTRTAPGIGARDHVVVGAARKVVRKYRAAIAGTNVKWVVGADAPDGADRALLAAIDLHRVARDFDELVIISGDHAFADLARRAKALGLHVHVVTAEQPGQRSMLSRELSAAAGTHTLVRLTSRPSHRDIVASIADAAHRARRVRSSEPAAA